MGLSVFDSPQLKGRASPSLLFEKRIHMIIQAKTFDAERALYNLQDATVRDCAFAGPADGESALKEARNIQVENCKFSLRYPLWHTVGFRLKDSTMDEKSRAAIWYAQQGEIAACTLGGIKCLRECADIRLADCRVMSEEFGWKCQNIQLTDCTADAQYIFFDSRDLTLSRFILNGKYSFQYTQNVTVTDSELYTKDAFWHAKNVTVKNTVLKGEYLGWYSDGLTLINCHIIGTQPLCYCQNLKLIDCTMEATDLSFEYSQVEATVKGHIDSVKNPASGSITADSIGQVIWEDSVIESTCQVQTR